jgi:glycerol transport system ATP-binding protein
MGLTLQNLEKRVGAQTHLYPLTLEFQPGLNVLLGPTLAGKTSLMRMMAGLDKPSAGQVLVDGNDVTAEPVQKRSVAFVYQQFVNYQSFTVFENIASPLRVQGGISTEDIKRRVHQAAELMHLETMLDRLPAQLSGGQQQRTAIARALIKEASLLLLDEPLVNLDYKLREELRAEMREIFAQRNAIVVYSTTEPLEALMMGGQIAVMSEGRLLQSGNTLSVYHAPASQRVGEVFSDPPMNLLAAQIAGGQATLSNGAGFALPDHMRALPGGSYRFGLRANHTNLQPASGHDLKIAARVELGEISGSETYVHTQLESPTPPGERVVAQLEGVHSYRLHSAVTLYINPNRLFAFDSGGRLAAAPERAQKVGVM